MMNSSLVSACVMYFVTIPGAVNPQMYTAPILFASEINSSIKSDFLATWSFHSNFDKKSLGNVGKDLPRNQ